MLVNLSIDNWMSFRDRAKFTMVATKEQQHGERLARVKKYRIRLLPAAVLYGGNASGKTNFFRAINFLKHFVVRGTSPEAPIPVELFGLRQRNKKRPAEFSLEILIQDTIYEFGFAVNHEKVIEERLVKVTSTSEKTLYHRVNGSGDPHLHGSVESQRLRFAFEGTRDNQLFLTNSVSQKLDTFKPIYDWFARTLVLVAPDTRFDSFEQFIQTGSPLYETMNAILPKLDTGICHLGGENTSFDAIRLPEPIKQKVKEGVGEGNAIRIVVDNDEKIIVSRESGELKARKLYTYHLDSTGKRVPFEMKQESDGSKRIIDLLPGFLDLAQTQIPKVYVVDELDRSLHSLLTQQLLEVYLSSCNPESRKQLMFTTHDLMLMNQKIFRRDELWITERRQDGSSQLISFSEYDDVRNDKDILKSYLRGRMGGIPRVVTSQISGEDRPSGAD